MPHSPGANNQSYLDPAANTQRNNITSALMKVAAAATADGNAGHDAAMPGGAMPPMQPPQMPPPGMGVLRNWGAPQPACRHRGCQHPGMPPNVPLSPVCRRSRRKWQCRREGIRQ